MKIGVVFPQTEIGADPGGVREFAQAAEAMGYSHILAFDHVIGASRASRPDWAGPYDLDSLFHEPFVMFGYMAGLTASIEFATGIVILPQRQTVLVAKQAAALDVLSGGRLRLGIGIGWNEVEFEALNENFRDRGRRSEEQVEVMRALWTQEAVTFNGRWHTITDAGINPLPVQRPIPVWFGGGAEAVLRRIARIGDGWMPQWQPGDEGRAQLAKLHEYARDAGRDPAEIGIDGRVAGRLSSEAGWADAVQAWRDIGATHIEVSTMGDGLRGPEAHIQRLEQFTQAAGL
ncbi:MAG: LLM class F420-dependent oxidoreductase [Dehalococcoidia bacterium]